MLYFHSHIQIGVADDLPSQNLIVTKILARGPGNFSPGQAGFWNRQDADTVS
jgi:hypothetical protein